MFYVLEGIDGAGCGAQRKNLEKKLAEKKVKISTLKYPYYDSPVGRMLKEFQHGERKLSTEMQFILYASQMVDEKEKIAQLRKEGTIISDHYIIVTLAYQCVIRGFPLENGLAFTKIFKMEIPDKIIFLDTPPSIAYQRKLHEEGKDKLDQNESDYNFILQADQAYRKLMAGQTLAPWIAIDNTKSIDEVTDEIIHCITNL